MPVDSPRDRQSSDRFLPFPGQEPHSGDSNDDSYSSPKSSQGSVLGGQRGRRPCPHVSDETQRGLLALLETSQQQQQVTFLVHQSFPEALSAQVALVQPLQLAVARHIIDGSVFSFCGDLGELVLCAPQLSLQAGESMFEGGSLLTQ